MKLSIVEKLINEHAAVDKLFKNAESCDENKRQSYVEKIKDELDPKSENEEKALYTILLDILSGAPQVFTDTHLSREIDKDNRAMVELLRNLESVNVNDKSWSSHLVLLRDNINKHIADEEVELYRLAKYHFTSAELISLKDAYISLKKSSSKK